VPEPEPEPEPEQEPEPEPEQEQEPRGRGRSRRRLGGSAEFMRGEVAKLKATHGEEYEPTADDMDRIRAALVAQ
jgi:hypothetical protein